MLNDPQEVFVDVVGYEGLYKVSNLGYVTNGRKILKTYQINSGYTCLKLTKEGKATAFLLHRLVAQTFIPNPETKAEVNHKNGNKADCGVTNLEWMTSAENKQHARATGLAIYNEPSKGIKIGNSSKYHNVLWDKSRNKWVGVVRHENKNYFQKRFNTEEEAAIHVNWILDTLGLTDRPRNIVELKA